MGPQALISTTIIVNVDRQIQNLIETRSLILDGQYSDRRAWYSHYVHSFNFVQRATSQTVCVLYNFLLLLDYVCSRHRDVCFLRTCVLFDCHYTTRKFVQFVL